MKMVKTLFKELAIFEDDVRMIPIICILWMKNFYSVNMLSNSVDVQSKSNIDVYELSSWYEPSLTFHIINKLESTEKVSLRIAFIRFMESRTWNDI